MDTLGVCIFMLCRVHWCKTSLTTMMNIWLCLTLRYLWPRRWKGKMNCSEFATDRNQYLNNHTAEALSVKGHQMCEFNTEHHWRFSYCGMLLLIVKKQKLLVIFCFWSFHVWEVNLSYSGKYTVSWCGCWNWFVIQWKIQFYGVGVWVEGSIWCCLFCSFLFSEQKLLLFCSRACFFPCKCVCLSLHDVTGIKVTVECKCTE